MRATASDGEGASAPGSVDAEGYQNECDRVEHPANMSTARRPKVAERPIQIGAADKQAGREPCVLLEPDCCGDQGESAEKPVERAEMQQPRHDPSDRSGHPFVREKKRLEWPDHQPLDQDAVNHRYAASDGPSQSQGSVLPSHAQCASV